MFSSFIFYLISHSSISKCRLSVSKGEYMSRLAEGLTRRNSMKVSPSAPPVMDKVTMLDDNKNQKSFLFLYKS